MRLFLAGRGWRAMALACVAGAALLAGSVAWGQVATSASGGTQPAMRVTRITLSAQRLEKPDLTYTLIPRIEDTQPGNAAIKYMEASAYHPKRPEDEPDTIDKQQHCPLAELDETTVQEIVAAYGYQLRALREGAHIDGVEWETQVREKGFAALLPSFSPLRQVANVLHLAIRLDIKHHRWADARDKLQTGYGLAMHQCQGETLIGSLVGVAIAATMSKAVEEWVAEPGSPNLYWPLAALPNPFGDTRRPLAFERATAAFNFPELRQMQQGDYSADAWIKLMAHVSDLARMMETSDRGGKLPRSPALQHAMGLASAMAEYPRAKRFLLDRGMNAEQVEKMPVPEVLERYFVRSLDEQYDDIFKWLSLPLPEGRDGCDKAEREFEQAGIQANLLARILLPNLGRAKVLTARADRQIAMLRIVENLRAYAADGKTGSFPDTLDQLPLPVPLNPMTARPFVYERRGDTAVLSDPGYNGKAVEGYRYEITLRR